MCNGNAVPYFSHESFLYYIQLYSSNNLQQEKNKNNRQTNSKKHSQTQQQTNERPQSGTVITSDSCRYDHITPLLNDLHWLRVPERITYKLCVLVYNCLHGTAPRYLQEIIQPVAEVTSRRRLPSASSCALVVPATRRSSLGDRAFAVAGPRAWNSEFVTSHLQEISQDLLI